MSIRLKVLGCCLALIALTGLVGSFAERTERELGRIAFSIYDECFMELSYLREAQVAYAGFAAHPQAATPAAVDDLMGDLDVVRQRATSTRAAAMAAQLQHQAALTLPVLARDRASVNAVQSAFGHLVEVVASDGFRTRAEVGRMVYRQLRHTRLMLGLSLAVALGVTVLLGQLIVPPLQRAVLVAQRIAGGDLTSPVAVGGRGETGDLLRALGTMQSSIADALGRIRALMDAQAVQHAGEIAAEHLKLDAALQNMSQGLCLFDPEGRLVMANRRAAEMFGELALGTPAGAVLRQAGLDKALADGAGLAEGAMACTLADGRSIAVTQHAVADGGWVATYEDVTERQAAEARLAHLMRHDALTGLPNRLAFCETVHAALARPGAAGSVAVLCLDLDRFKHVNDTMGHAAGDALLQAMAARIKAAAGPDVLVARLGGNEFAAALIGSAGAIPGAAVMQVREATRLANRLIEAVTKPLEIAGQMVQIGTSIGIALPEDTGARTTDGTATPAANPAGTQAMDAADMLMGCADLALRRAKSAGRGGYQFFEPQMNLAMQARRALEQDLRGALAADQLDVFYQPLMAASGGVCGFEALVRWHHPERGMVSPADFIPLAEETGLIDAIGLWVLRRACTDCAGWGGALKVAVNLSPAQFRTATLAADVIGILRASGLPPQRLELEITESVLLGEQEDVILALYDLRAEGIRIAMDDFGTGYSSLSYLRRFPVDKIKIDQSFVRNMCDKEDCRAIVRAVIGLGRSLNIAVNAEGVETTEQHAALLQEGCGELQGYLFSKPRPAADVPALLQALGVSAKAARLGTQPGAPPGQPALRAAGRAELRADPARLISRVDAWQDTTVAAAQS